MTKQQEDQAFLNSLKLARGRDRVESFACGLLIGFLIGFSLMMIVIVVLHNANMARLGF